MTGRLYQLETRDATGVFLGLSLAAVLLIGGGLTLTVALRLLGVPILVAVLPLLLATGLAKLPLGGRPLHQWVPLLGDWVASGVTGRRQWRGVLPLFPATDRSDDLPPVLRGIDVVEMTMGGHEVAAVRDRRTACLTVLVPVKVAQFAGADAGTQDALLAGWGNVLAAHAAAGSPVTQIGWSHQSMSSTFADHRQWLDNLGRTDADLADYGALIDEVAGVAAPHDTIVWMTVSGRVAGKGKALDRAATSLPGALDQLRASLEDAGLRPQATLTVPELWRLLRRRADPSANATEADSSPSLAARMGLLGPGGNGPALAIDTSWSEVHVDGTWHRVGWVETWPRRAVPADWLSGFLLAEALTMTVLYRPIPPERSQRRVDSQLVKLSAHRARKEEKGRRVTETDRRTEQAVMDLESDLASGHGEVLYLGLACVSAPSREALDERWQRTEQAARAAQMGLRVLHGRQDIAWAASLPCGLTEPGALELVGL